MPTAIAVTSRELVLPPPDGQTPSAVVLPSPQDKPLDGCLAAAQSLLDRQGYLVVPYAGATPPPAIRRLRTVRALLESDRIALLPLDLPPLGVAVLARQLRRLSVCDLSPGVLASAARLLAHYIHAGAQLASVARLDRVPVGLGSHVRSWLPGTRFGVLAHPTPRLVKVGGGDDTPPAPGYAVHFTVARGHQHTGDWVTGTLASAWRAQGVQEVPLPPESARWWGTGRLTEFAAEIPDLSVLYQLVTSVRRQECHWCGLELIGDRCAFCSSPVPSAAAPRALAAAPSALASAPPARPALTSRPS
ncbi:hypothetical protein [Streptomyces sp. XD-27]|uniref:hypothetical protein n=1 Tax=Streptomyces sp. XD-27 TaxID=3062779 RepID=UPI0026F40C8D|nr:hypothetical protein [Streptomyces sp. XD-27]WKX72292.1 hypothetical protein Q3Y56_22455 [Streptomyces sp. XD-27]